MESFDLDTPLPIFRQDLKLYRAPDTEKGEPSYSLYDPVRAQYYQITWEQSLIFRWCRPGLSAKDLSQIISDRTPSKIAPEALLQFFQEASRLRLLRTSSSKEQLLAESEARKQHPVKWLLFHYLYVKIPLFSPDRFLEKTLPLVRLFVSPVALWIYAFAIILGLFQVVLHFDEFIHTFSYFFSWRGLLAYALTLSFTKVIHELAHAYTAKYYGVRVSTMGVAFLVLWPVMYTDVTDAWKLSKRKQRFAISFSGVVAELVIAGLCTLGWALSSPGILQSTFFVVASAMWISTLLVNFNPAMRFDGYYLLCDLWGVDNLQEKAFSVARWQIRKWLLGLHVLPPYKGLSRRRVLGMVVYSVCTWIYRFFLYTAIAALVYYKFTKPLGILLFLAEIIIFFLWPIWSELQQFSLYRRNLKRNRRMEGTILLVSISFAWLFLPLPHSERFVAVVEPVRQQVMYVPYPSRISELHVERGKSVKPGDKLFTLVSQKLNNQIETTLIGKEILERKIFILGDREEGKAFLPEKKAELATLDAHLTGLMETRKRLTIRSSIEGEMFMLDEFLRLEQSVSGEKALGVIGSIHEMEALFYLPEQHANLLKKGDRVFFRIAPGFQKMVGEVTYTSPTRAIYLDYPQIGSINQGELPVQKGERGELILMESYYIVRMRFDTPPEIPLRVGQVGEVQVFGKWRSLALDGLRYITSVLIRESGF